MARFANAKTEMQTEEIYEIFRACRLCGAGAGYKMPIIQSVLELDDVTLKQKIRECVQIEVQADDKMPPLICELCVDKVNDYYEFLDMCRQTNKRTRLRLGLPPQTLPRGAPDAGDCILGITEPVYVDKDEDNNEPLKKRGEGRKRAPEIRIKLEKQDLREMKERKEKEFKERRETRDSKDKRETRNYNQRETRDSNDRRDSKDRRDTRDSRKEDKNTKDKRETRESKKEPHNRSDSKDKKESKELRDLMREAKDCIDTTYETESRTTRYGRQKSPSPVRFLRGHSKDDYISLSQLKSKEKIKKSPVVSPPPRSILKKEKLIVKIEEPIPVLRLKRTQATVQQEVPSKKVKISSPPPSPKAARKPPKPEVKSPPPVVTCVVCEQDFKTAQAMISHTKTHVVGFTNISVACNLCGVWFPEITAALNHHRDKHKSKYPCVHCGFTLNSHELYTEHIKSNECRWYSEVPDMKCDECWESFPTRNLIDTHDCTGADGRAGGKCSKCHRMYSKMKTLLKHESMCTVRKKGTPVIDPKILALLRELQVRITRCDELLKFKRDKHYDVSTVDHEYGLDNTCIYPYLYSRPIKCALDYDSMVKIQDYIKNEFDEIDFVHWDSDDDSIILTNHVESLATLSLKTIFSKRCLGKVPRKRRKVKPEKAFDSILNDTDIDMRRNIDNIIDNLDNDDDWDSNRITNDMFDVLKKDDQVANVNNEIKPLKRNHEVNDTDTANDIDKNKELSNDKASINDITKENNSNKEIVISKESDNHENQNIKSTNDVQSMESDRVKDNGNISNDLSTSTKELDHKLKENQDSVTKSNEDASEVKVQSVNVNDKVESVYRSANGEKQEDIDDKELMDEIDAQLGETKDKVDGSLTQRNDDLKSMDLDSISDEDFDMKD